MTALDTLSLNRRIDDLCRRWLAPGMPGGVIGVIREGEWLVRRGFGLASLELGMPNRPETVYRIASVTKQFTTGCILLLAAEGRVSLDADVREWFPRLADFGHRIAVRHLMQNTSGLRDQLEITRLGGMTLATPCTADDVLDAILRQRTLNFVPGERFLYSNTNFRLLGLIVEAVTGQALATVMAERFFEPLGMSQTRLVRDTNEVVPGLATGYLEPANPPDGAPAFVRAVHAYPLGGEGGVASSLDDLALWARNLDHPIVGGPDLVQALTSAPRFNNGRPSFYANGVELGRHGDLDSVGHGGLWPGFRTEFVRFPAARLTVICIANVGSFDPYATARRIADIVLDAPRPPMPASEALPSGLYLDRATPATAEFTTAGRQLQGRMNGVSFTLAPSAGGSFKALRGAFDLTFTFADGHDRLTVELSSGQRTEFERLPQRGVLPIGLDGRYQSDELAADWTIAGDTLSIAGPLRRTSAPWTVLPLDADLFQITSTDPFQPSTLDARVIRGADSSVAGLLVQGGRIKNLRLTRVGPA